MAMQRSSRGPDPWDECSCNPTSVKPNDLWQRWLWSQETSAALLRKAVVTAQSWLIQSSRAQLRPVARSVFGNEGSSITRSAFECLQWCLKPT